MTEKYPARFGDEVLDYEWDWAARLEEGETVIDVTVSLTGPAGLTLDSESTIGSVTTFWISGGGTRAADAIVNLLATTSAGRALGEKVTLPIRGR